MKISIELEVHGGKYCRTYDNKHRKVYFFKPLEKEISVEDMQKIVDANEKLVKDLKDGSK